MEKQISGLTKRLQHVGIPVVDVVASESFYRSLGFKKAMESPFQEEGKTGTCVMMKNGEVIIELYQLPEHKIKEIRDRKDGHIDHITFDVNDIDLAYSTLKNASFHIIEEKPVFLPFWENGCKYFNVLGPNGERLEFNQIL